MRIGFIGAGNMVSAIVRGAVAAGTPAGHLLLTSKHGSAERLAAQVGGRPRARRRRPGLTQ